MGTTACVRLALSVLQVYLILEAAADADAPQQTTLFPRKIEDYNEKVQEANSVERLTRQVGIELNPFPFRGIGFRGCRNRRGCVHKDNGEIRFFVGYEVGSNGVVYSVGGYDLQEGDFRNSTTNTAHEAHTLL